MECEGNILENSFIREEAEILEDRANLPAEFRNLPAREFAQIFTGDIDLAGCWILFLENEAKECRFT